MACLNSAYVVWLRLPLWCHRNRDLLRDRRSNPMNYAEA